tara:strand:- start:843 stop:1085 length:243 start_codon:yes stop_codon:yes gene_type:complete
MDNHDVKTLFILIILIGACGVVLCQFECFQCNCNCKKLNRGNVQQIVVQGVPLEVVVIGEPVMDREDDTCVQGFVVNISN